EAIPMLARDAGWTYQRGEIEKILRRDDQIVGKEAFETRADAYLGRVVREFYRTGSRYLLIDTLESIWRMLAHTSATDVSNYYFSDGISSIKLYATEPWMFKLTQGLAVCSPEARDRLVAFQQTPWFRVW